MPITSKKAVTGVGILTSPIVYQGIERWEMLRLVRRLCLQGKDELLENLCGSTADPGETVEAWFHVIRRRLEESIRATGARDGREAMTMALFCDSASALQALSASLPALCRAWARDTESKTESVFWNTLNQYFKRKMDELDGYGGEHGTHVLQAKRRIDKMAKELVESRAAQRKGRNRYASLADLAADLAVEVRRRHLEKQLPATPTKILEYLYESEATAAVSEDPWDDKLILGEIVSSETLIQFEQCIEILPAELREALTAKFGASEEPVFLDDEAYKRHYGIGREAMRKRVFKAQRQLLACLLSGDIAR